MMMMCAAHFDSDQNQLPSSNIPLDVIAYFFPSPSPSLCCNLSSHKTQSRGRKERKKNLIRFLFHFFFFYPISCFDNVFFSFSIFSSINRSRIMAGWGEKNELLLANVIFRILNQVSTLFSLSLTL